MKSFKAETVQKLDINIQASVIADMLANDPDFVEKISNKIRKEMLRDVRRLPNLWGKWAGK